MNSDATRSIVYNECCAQRQIKHKVISHQREPWDAFLSPPDANPDEKDTLSYYEVYTVPVAAHGHVSLQLSMCVFAKRPFFCPEMKKRNAYTPAQGWLAVND